MGVIHDVTARGGVWLARCPSCRGRRIRPEDLGRFAAVGAIANFQPLWACSDRQMEELTLPFVGSERAGWQYSIRSLLSRGVPVAFGSDWPVSSPDPLQVIHVAVNRSPSGRLGQAGTSECDKPFRPGEAIGISEALAAYTRGVALVNGEETVTGVLTPGMRADIAVLDQQVFSVPARAARDPVS